MLRTFTDDDVILFARISRDYNPVHFDDRFAKVKNFSSPICRGVLSASLLTEIGGPIGWICLLCLICARQGQKVPKETNRNQK
ncbi:MAG: MaoC/PaaZ C-terminal domain-containing protein [Desulfobacterium sp.]|nr:MaoC/PaaZ C-terminal domain-containing protein [Desulfobacterium sp.]